MYQIKFKASVQKDLKKIDNAMGKKIIEKIYSALSKNPKIGLPLKGNGKGLWRYRIGDYRIVYKFNDEELWILVVHIAHRKDVYEYL